MLPCKPNITNCKWLWKRELVIGAVDCHIMTPTFQGVKKTSIVQFVIYHRMQIKLLTRGQMRARVSGAIIFIGKQNHGWFRVERACKSWKYGEFLRAVGYTSEVDLLSPRPSGCLEGVKCCGTGGPLCCSTRQGDASWNDRAVCHLSLQRKPW